MQYDAPNSAASGGTVFHANFLPPSDWEPDPDDELAVGSSKLQSLSSSTVSPVGA